MGKKGRRPLKKTFCQQDKNGVSEIEYEVEEILAKRFKKNGEPEYFLKWKDYDPQYNTWEPVEHICPKMIKKFEEKLTSKEKDQKNGHGKQKISSSSSSGSDINQKSKDRSEVNNGDKKMKVGQKHGFDRGLAPDYIIGITGNPEDDKKGHMFLMKWKGSDEADLVHHREANVKCPEVVIKYFEERLILQNHLPVFD